MSLCEMMFSVHAMFMPDRNVLNVCSCIILSSTAFANGQRASNNPPIPTYMDYATHYFISSLISVH